jgi:hypothetical protein
MDDDVAPDPAHAASPTIDTERDCTRPGAPAAIAGARRPDAMETR